MCMKRKFFFFHSFENRLREVFENKTFLLWIDGPFERPRLTVDPHVCQSIAVIVVCKPVQHFKTLADSKNGPTNVKFIFLIYAVIVDFASGFVILVLSAIWEEHIKSTTCQKHSIN
jgi:hypothetical protein